MARTAQKVESLIEEDPALADALTVVVDRTGGDDGEVDWADVRDELSSGQWGRLIETGVLVDGEVGFRLADPAAVREVLEDGDSGGATSPGTDADGDESAGQQWTTWDKLAALGSVSLFAGYSLRSVRDLIGTTIDFFLGPLDAVMPFYLVVMVLALLTGLYSTLLQANLMDMEVLSQYQRRMKDIQRRQKAARESGDEEELEKVREEQMAAMGDQLGVFKLQFRPMVWIMVFTIPVFLWMYWKILAGHIDPAEREIIVPLVGTATWIEGIAGPVQLWIVWYFLSSMAFTQVIRKALNIQTTPT